MTNDSDANEAGSRRLPRRLVEVGANVTLVGVERGGESGGDARGDGVSTDGEGGAKLVPDGLAGGSRSEFTPFRGV